MAFLSFMAHTILAYKMKGRVFVNKLKSKKTFANVVIRLKVKNILYPDPP